MNIGYQKVGRWYLIRKVEFFPFDIYLVNEGYVHGKNPALRWRFKNTLLYYANGYTHSFRGVQDLEGLQKFLKNNFNRNFVDRVEPAIRSAADELLIIARKTFADRKSLEQNIDRFYESFRIFFSVFQTPELSQMTVPDKDRTLLYKFGLARDYAARKLARVEHIYRVRLGMLLRIHAQEALMLLPNEVKTAISTNVLPKKFKQRRACVLFTRNGITRVYWNRKADALFAREVVRHKKTHSTGEFVGQVAYAGKVKGKVYVALNEKDFKKIPRGAILVCSMTRYTIVPYLKRVSAIVTDQGGITCHAAIMARELKVPTLIGAQGATDTFKTGDRVEVDALKGIVREIK